MYSPLFRFSAVLSILVYLPASNLKAQASTTIGSFELSSSCEPYKAKLQNAFANTYDLTRAGYREAGNNDSLFFPRYFKNEDRSLVQLIMREAGRRLVQNRHRIPLECNSGKAPCTQGHDTAAFYGVLPTSDGGKEQGIGLCGFLLDGTQGEYPLETPVCGQMGSKLSVSAYFLHEMIHLEAVNNKTHMRDWAYGEPECKALANTDAHDKDTGEAISPATNPQSYVWLAIFAHFIQTAQDCKQCPEQCERFQDLFNQPRESLQVYTVPVEDSGSLRTPKSTDDSSECTNIEFLNNGSNICSGASTMSVALTDAVASTGSSIPELSGCNPGNLSEPCGPNLAIRIGHGTPINDTSTQQETSWVDHTSPNATWNF